MDKGVQQEI